MLSHATFILVVCLSLLATLVHADDTVSALAVYPECARPCMVNEALCGPTDKTCMCTNEAFQAKATVCVSNSCSIPDALAAQNSLLTTCGAPVRDRSHRLVLTSNTFIIVSAIFIILRFGYKITMKRLDIGLDDWLVLACFICTIPSNAITAHGTTPNGLGKDIWTLTPTNITKVVRFFYAMACLYYIQVTLVKLSFISFYLRIFPSQGVQRTLWSTFIGTSIWGVTFLVVCIFQCKPIHYFWVRWDGMHEGKCVNINAFTWAHSAMSIALDFWILLIPLSQLRKLHLHWKKKIPIGLMFIVGTFVTIVSILRLQSLLTFAASHNSTWEFFDVSLWSSIEICVGIMCACLPTVRMCLVKIFPVLAGSSNGSKGVYYHTGEPRSGYGSNSRHRTFVSSRKTHDGENSQMGIEFQKTYVVQFTDREQDNDELSLSRTSELEPPAKTWTPAP